MDKDKLKKKVPKTDFEKLGEAIEDFNKSMKVAIENSFTFRWFIRLDNFKFSIKELINKIKDKYEKS